MNRSTKIIVGNYVATDDDEILLVDASASPGFWFVNLPVPTIGKVFTIRKTDATSKAVRIQFGTGITLDGKTLGGNWYALNAQHETLTVVSNGTGWQRLDQWTQNISGGNSAAVQPGNAYVSVHYGNDANSGLVPWAAKKTIAAALALPIATDIHVDRGIYTETVNLRSYQNKKLIGSGGVTIRAPAVDADVVILGIHNELSNVTLRGFNGPNWNGRCIVLEAGAGYNRVRRVGMGNGDGYLPPRSVSGGADPGYGGWGLYIRDTEQNDFEDIGFSQLRIGIDINDTGLGCSMNTFRRCNMAQNWKEIVAGGAIGTFHFEDFKSSGAGYAVAREHGYIWDLCIAGSTFVNCDWSEVYAGVSSRFRRDVFPGRNNQGGGNTFITCTNSLQNKLYIESDRNKFVNFYAQNDLVLAGDWNEIDSVYTTGGGNVQITGAHNSVRRHTRRGQPENQVKVTDNGLGTMIDGVRRGNGPPTTGYGWRKGTIVLNEAPQAGDTMGWICTEEALGPPQKQGGQWIELPVLG